MNKSNHIKLFSIFSKELFFSFIVVLIIGYIIIKTFDTSEVSENELIESKKVIIISKFAITESQCILIKNLKTTIQVIKFPERNSIETALDNLRLSAKNVNGNAIYINDYDIIGTNIKNSYKTIKINADIFDCRKEPIHMLGPILGIPNYYPNLFKKDQ